MATAFTRALHLYVDDPPHLLDDAVAMQLLPFYQRRFIQRLARLSRPWRRRFRSNRDALTTMRAQVLVRSRYAEDALAEARGAGVGRYIVLAAGLDTFALRQPEPRIPVVEIDHPATQSWKLQLFADRGITRPADTTFLPIDFERQTLEEVWVGDSTADFVSWLGATYYLTREAIQATLSSIAERTRPGSQLVLDYWREPPPTDLSGPLFWSTRFAVALQQEPMRSFFTPSQIDTLAQNAGWRVRENLPPAAQNRRYLATRRDRLSVPSFAHILHLER